MFRVPRDARPVTRLGQIRLTTALRNGQHCTRRTDYVANHQFAIGTNVHKRTCETMRNVRRYQVISHYQRKANNGSLLASFILPIPLIALSGSWASMCLALSNRCLRESLTIGGSRGSREPPPPPRWGLRGSREEESESARRKPLAAARAASSLSMLILKWPFGCDQRL